MGEATRGGRRQAHARLSLCVGDSYLEGVITSEACSCQGSEGFVIRLLGEVGEEGCDHLCAGGSHEIFLVGVKKDHLFTIGRSGVKGLF